MPSTAPQRGIARLSLYGAHAGSAKAIAFCLSPSCSQAHRPVLPTVSTVQRPEDASARAPKHQAGEIWALELGRAVEVAARLGDFDSNPIGAVRWAEAVHIEHIPDWYVATHVILTGSDITPFTTNITT